ALCDQVEERIAVVGAGELLLDNLPADRLAGLERREGVPEPGRARPEPPEGAQLFAFVGVSEAEAVARGLRDCAPDTTLPVWLIDALDQPEPPAELEHLPRGERFIGPVLLGPFLRGGTARHQFVVHRHAWAHSAGGSTG